MTKEVIEAENEDKRLEFVNQLWWLFRSDRGPHYSIKAIAPELGLSPDCLTKYIRGDLTFPVYHIPALVNATRDRTILDYIVDRCSGFRLEINIESDELNGELTDEIEALTIALGKLVEEKCSALKDKVLTEDEKHVLTARADSILDIAERIKREINAGVKE